MLSEGVVTLISAVVVFLAGVVTFFSAVVIIVPAVVTAMPSDGHKERANGESLISESP